MTYGHQHRHRSGTILIIVAGVSALMASFALAFLMHARSDIEEVSATMHDAQARIMLTAACSYISEASRLGWDPVTSLRAPRTTSKEHVEGHGWIDVRDGSMGPRTVTAPITQAQRDGNPHPLDPTVASDPNAQGALHFPVGVPRRFPMHVWERPPYAIRQQVNYNPVDYAGTDQGRSYLRYPDPQPALPSNRRQDPQNPAGNASEWAEWVAGDNRPRQDSTAQAWFRILREPTGAVFTVTCGAGGTWGYRDWNTEVIPDGATALFNNDPELFKSLQTQEIRLWYRVEWNAATTSIDMNYLREHHEHKWGVSTMTYQGGGGSNNGYSGQFMAPNMGGTIQWIQRLRHEPAVW